jgi:tRNA pseudouridine55 synthase
VDGLLVIDKPVGPTSHDVVARLRRVLRERRIGHTGTLDPAASGVLPIVIGRATRLARFLSGTSKIYEAVVRLGFATTTGDAVGESLGPVFGGPFPDRAALDAALCAFRGTFLQQPPAFSAKKIGGERSYVLARRQVQAPLPDPVSVTTYALDVLSVENDLLTLRVECSAGFYVRSLAQDLGAALGTGAHLAGLRRTKSGSLTIAAAVPLGEVESDPDLAARRRVPMAGMLTDYPSVVLSIEGVRHAAQGRTLRPADFAVESARPTGDGPTGGLLDQRCHVRLLTPSGDLLGLADWQAIEGDPPVLHPSVVLG